MGFLFKSVCVVLLFLNVSFSDDRAQAWVSGVTGKKDYLEETHQDGKGERFAESKQENENVFLNNSHIVEGSSKTSLVEEVNENNGNGGIYEEWSSTTQYDGEGYVTRSPLSGRVGAGVYEEPSSEMGEVLEPDHKEEGDILTDQLGNENGDEINPSEKTNIPSEYFESQSEVDVNDRHVIKSPGVLSSEVQVDDFMKSRIHFTVESSTESITITDTTIIDENPLSNRPLIGDLNKIASLPDLLTIKDTFGNYWKKDTHENKYNLKSLFREGFHSSGFDSEKYHQIGQPIDLKLNVEGYNERIIKNDECTKTDQEDLSKATGDELGENQSDLTRSTTDTTSRSWMTEGKIIEEIKSSEHVIDSVDKGSTDNVPDQYRFQRSSSSDDVLITLVNDEIGSTADSISSNSSKKENNNLTLEQIPIAEKLYSFNNEHENSENKLNNGLDLKSLTETSIPRPLREYEDKSDEGRVVIKSLLYDYPSFKNEKIEPGVLFEECPDCDLRVLPIRPSEQRSTPNLEAEPLPSSKIRFAELPEGRGLQINSLGLSDGIFLFSYLGQFLSWIQPNEFPVELLRDALKNQITWIRLITQSVQIDAGFVACLVAVVLLALAVPVVFLSHACYRMGGRPEDQVEGMGWGGNCKRRTLVFILQLLLVLLFAGMVAMFVTNEQLSSAVVQSSDVLQTSLNDVSGFIHNSHLQLHFLVTQSLDQVLQAIYADLDNVDSLLGQPIQQELVRETGLDVALDSLGDLTREAKTTTQQVERFLDEARIAQEMLLATRDKLADLRQQVELFRRACGPRDRLLCDTIDASGLDVTLRLDRIKADERLNRMRRMGGVGLEAATVEAKEHFMSVPNRVDTETRDAREAVRRQVSRQRAEVDERGRGLEQFVREISTKVNEAKYQVGFWMQDLDQFEYWRWIICMGGGAAVLMIWTMLLCSMCCGCCGSEKAAGPTILVTIVLVCLFSTALWIMVLVGLLVGGHGEVFVCRPLYDEPDFPMISSLVDEPGVFYSEPHGGFIANVIYGNDSLDVPIRQVLQDCRDNRAIYPTLGLHRVFDVEASVDQHRWSSVNSHVRAVRANLSSLEVLSPALTDQLSDLLATLSVNFTEHRMQLSKPVTGKDLDSFARQLDNIGNQMRDLATASRMETLSSRTRRLIDSHIRPLEGRKDALVYQMTALEVQTGPLQRQVNQSLSHLKTIQFFINSQGESIAHRKSREYVERLLSYVDQLREHVVHTAKNSVAPCRPLWDIFHNTRLFLCRHTMDPLNGYWFATMWCLLVLLVATPVCLKLVDYYRARSARASGSPTENLMISEQGTGWSSPGYDIKGSKEYSGDYK